MRTVKRAYRMARHAGVIGLLAMFGTRYNWNTDQHEVNAFGDWILKRVVRNVRH